MKYLLFLIVSIASFFGHAQDLSDKQKDSLYILEIEDIHSPDKVLHAEPLYIDLIRDLGARKGEKEWNYGLGLTDNTKYNSYEMLIEYEFAPVNRLGLEVELPFSFHFKNNGESELQKPKNKLNGLKTAIQWSFFVSEKKSLSLALGYINELLLNSFHHYNENIIVGNSFNPFLIVAKRWGNNTHSLIYTGPNFEYHKKDETHVFYELNASMHYMISGTKNFIGIETNTTFTDLTTELILRPQMRLGIADNFLIGIVVGLPVIAQQQRLSTFLRIIWEPGHKHV